MSKSAKQPKSTANDTPIPTPFPGDYGSFIEALPPMVRTVSDFDLNYLWQRAQDNARRAKVLETKGETLADLFQRLRGELGEHDLTFEDLVAYEREARGGEVFSHEPDYLLPERYRRDKERTG